MKIRKINELDNYGLYDNVKNVFSYVLDEFDGVLDLNKYHISIMFNDSQFRSSDINNIKELVRINRHKLNLFEAIDECLDKLAIDSDIYYYLNTSNNGTIILLIKTDYSSGFKLLKKL